MNSYKILAGAITLLFTAALSAQTCKYESITESTPTSGFTIKGNTVIDNATNLEWQRCRLGTTWDGSGCLDDNASGEQYYNWEQALQAADSNELNGHSDWRLPNIKELASIIEVACSAPPLNLDIFTDMPLTVLWSSSPYSANIDFAWSLDVQAGYGDHTLLRLTYLHVLLVRSVP